MGYKLFLCWMNKRHILTTNGENQLLVNYKQTAWASGLQVNYWSFQRNIHSIPWIREKISQHVTIWIRNTRNLADHGLKPPWTLYLCAICPSPFLSLSTYEQCLFWSFSLHFLLLFVYYILFWHKANMPTPKHKRQLTSWQVLCQVERKFHNRESNLFALVMVVWLVVLTTFSPWTTAKITVVNYIFFNTF